MSSDPKERERLRQLAMPARDAMLDALAYVRSRFGSAETYLWLGRHRSPSCELRSRLLERRHAALTTGTANDRADVRGAEWTISPATTCSLRCRSASSRTASSMPTTGHRSFASRLPGAVPVPLIWRAKPSRCANESPPKSTTSSAGAGWTASCWGSKRSLALSAGSELPYAEEVERCFDAPPTRTPPAVYERVRSELDELLPGSGTLQDRLEARDNLLTDPRGPASGRSSTGSSTKCAGCARRSSPSRAANR